MKIDRVNKPKNRGFLNQILSALHPVSLIHNLLTSVIVWLIAVILATSFSALIFHGRLGPYYSEGIGIAIMSAMVITLMVSLFGSDQSTLAYPQSTAAALLGAMATSIVASAPASMSDGVLFATVLLAISFTSLLTGLLFLILGVLHGGNLIRYIPYPVISGFLAGSGWILIQGGLNVMVELQFSFDTLVLLFDVTMIVRWLPGMIMALLIIWAVRRTNRVIVLPIFIVGALILFYAVLYSQTNNSQFATQSDWFLQGFSDDVLWQYPDLKMITQIDGMLLLSQAGNIAAVIIISTLHFLLNASGMELVVDRELDLNHELAVTGAGNALSAMLGGGIIGFPSITFATLAHRMGSHGRIVGVMLTILLGLTLVFGASIITFFPRMILGGILMYLGFNFLVERLYDAWFQLPFKDYLIVLIIFVVIGMFGFLEGVAVGIVATIVLFVLEYSRISIVKQEFSGTVFRSNIDRSYAENAILRDMGQHIWVMKLQGFIFFGTSNEFFHRIQSRVLDPEQEALLYVILDFRLVRGIDVSTVFDFIKLRQLAMLHGIHLLFAGVSTEVEEVLIDCGFGALNSDVSYQFSDIDHAMEWCEDKLLEHADIEIDVRVTIKEQFESRTMTRMLDVSVISQYMERVEIDAGEYIAHQGDDPDVLYFIESGRVDIQLEKEHETPLRLRSMSAGTVIGEVGFYLGRPRSASIIVTESGIFHKLTRESLQRMSEEKPDSASGFHIFIACVIAERLSATNRMIEELIE